MEPFSELVDRRTQGYSLKWQGPAIDDQTIPLDIADMDFRCARPIHRALLGVLSHGVFGYATEATGDYENAIVQWFRRRHGWQVKGEEIIPVAGTRNGLKELIFALTKPGDGILIQRPVYSHLTTVIEWTGRQVINNQLVREANYYRMDLADLAKKASLPETKLMIICHPHDPVGRVWQVDELQAVSRICRKQGVILVAEETQGDLVRQGIDFHPMGTIADRSKLITLTSVSKAFNLAGLQGANLIVQDEVLRERLREKMSVHLPSPFTIGAVIAAYHESEEWLDRLKVYLDDTIDWVMAFLARKLPLVRTIRPEGTYVLWLDFQKTGMTPEEIHRLIYQYAGVLLEWGSVSDPDKGQLFERVCLAAPRPRIETAFERLAIEFDADF